MTRATRLFTACSLVLASLSALACGSPPPPVPSTSEPASSASAAATTAEPPAPTPTPAPEPGAPEPTASAKTCTSSADCAKGEVCMGEMGCDTTWTCKPSPPCTKDLQTYCGCDGKTFHGSGSCPGQKYSKRGGC